MENVSHEPHPPIRATRACSTPHSAPVGWLKASREPVEGTEAQAAPPDIPQPPAFPATRHDGWTGERIATFCEALAETAVVAEACDAAGMGLSGAYAARRRNPIFAAAWEAALTIARERLADTLLARAMEGNIEQIWRGGEIVGERHVLDNRLGLAILRRLDRLAEGGVCVSARDLPFSPSLRKPAPRSGSFNWEHAVDALRTGDDEGVARALALVENDEVDEVETLRGGGDDEPFLDQSARCWRDPIDLDVWMTDFPPPDNFTGYENRPYDEEDDDAEVYERACTAEEAAILDADIAAQRAAERAEDEEVRDEWFGLLRAGLAADEDDQPDGDSDRQQQDDPPPLHPATPAAPATKAATCKNRHSAAG